MNRTRRRIILRVTKSQNDPLHNLEGYRVRHRCYQPPKRQTFPTYLDAQEYVVDRRKPTKGWRVKRCLSACRVIPVKAQRAEAAAHLRRAA